MAAEDAGESAPVHDPDIEDTEITPQKGDGGAKPPKINKGLFGDPEDDEPQGKTEKPQAKKAAPKKGKAEKPAKAESKTKIESPTHSEDEDEEGGSAEDDPNKQTRIDADEEEEGEEDKEGEGAGAEEDKAGEEEGEAGEDDDASEEELDVEMTINGKQVSKVFTLRELARFAQKSAAAEERFESGKQLYESAKQQITLFRKDPLGVLDRLIRAEYERSGTPKSEARRKSAEYIKLLANRYLAPHIEEANMSEPERRMREIKRELEEMETERATRLREIEEEESQAKAEAQAQQLHRAMVQAFGELERKHNPELEERATEIFYKYLDRGIRVTPREALSEVLRERTDLLAGYLQRAEPEEIFRLRPDLGTRVSQANLAKVKKAQEAALEEESGEVPAERADQRRPKRKKAFASFGELERDAGPWR